MPDPAPLRTATAIEARAAAARAAFRTHLEALRTVDRASTGAEDPGFLTVVAAAFGPGGVIDTWRRWRAAPRREAPGQLDRLEQGVEDAQRQVSQVAVWLDTLRAEEQAIQVELEALRRDTRLLSAAAGSAAQRARALEQADFARELVELRALPAEGAALQADAEAARAELQGARAESVMFEAGAQRLAAVAAFGGEVVGWCGQLRASLEQVHAEGREMLAELDLNLGRLAAEARAADLGASLAGHMKGLRGAIGRVGVEARGGADALTSKLDRLAEAADLLAPADPARRAAEAEVDALLPRGRSPGPSVVASDLAGGAASPKDPGRTSS